METVNLLPYAIGVVIAIISFYLKGTIAELKSVQQQVQESKIIIEVLRTQHNNLGEKLDNLYSLIKEVQQELKVISRHNRLNSNGDE